MAGRLDFEERVRLEVLVGSGCCAAGAARVLGRHATTVQRELGRNGGVCGYRAEAAQAGAEARARRPKTPKLVGDPVLAEAVTVGLSRQWVNLPGFCVGFGP